MTDVRTTPITRSGAVVALILAALAMTGCGPSNAQVRRQGIVMAATGDNAGGIKALSTGIDMNGLPVFNTPATAPTAATQLINRAYADLATTTVKAIASVNISLSGLASTIDSVAINADGDEVLAVSQTAPNQEGCWLAHSGAWTRCLNLQSGDTADGRIFTTANGASNRGQWVLAGGVVGTNDLTAKSVDSGATIGTANINFASVASGLGLTVLGAYQSDLGVTLNGSNVSAWADQSGNSHDLSQASGSFQPPFTANDSTLGNKPSFTCTSASQHNLFNTTFDLPAPPITFYLVFKQTAWTAGHAFISAGSSGDFYELSPNTSSPGLIMYDGTQANLSNGAPVGTWVRGYATWTGSTSDTLKLGSAAAVTGTNSGTGNPAAQFNVCKTGNAVPAFGDVAIALVLVISGTPTSGNFTTLDSNVTTWSSGAVTL